MSDSVMEICNHIIDPKKIEFALNRDGWGCSVEEGYLMLLELLVKTSAGYYVSHTEGRFLAQFPLRMRNGQPNKVGREFIMRMCYYHSNIQSQVCILGQKYRKQPKEQSDDQ